MPPNAALGIKILTIHHQNLKTRNDTLNTVLILFLISIMAKSRVIKFLTVQNGCVSTFSFRVVTNI